MDIAYNLLPDYLKTDELEQFFAAISDQAAVCVDFINSTDPDTSGTGTSWLADPAQVLRSRLAWLSLLAGVDTTGADQRYMRADLADLAVRHRGTRASLLREAKRTLTGAKSVKFSLARSGYDADVDYDADIPFDGADLPGFPWLIRMRTHRSETPDPDGLFAAALREKPAGVVLIHSYPPGATYDDLGDDFATYDDMTGSALTYGELAVIE